MSVFVEFLVATACIVGIGAFTVALGALMVWLPMRMAGLFDN